MRALFIGGTGTISTAISKLSIERGWELYLLNRGKRSTQFANNPCVHEIHVDINDEAEVLRNLKDLTFDVVAEFIAFVPEHLQRDYRLFAGRTRQYIFISSASAYQKPVGDYRITEGTPLANPYWQYSRDKIACEDYLMKQYREQGFPITIVRPSHTYDEKSVPLGVDGDCGGWQVVKRMLAGKQVIIHGDGTSLWTMTHNSDFAKGFVGLMGNLRAIGEAVQITSDETLTWNQIYTAIANALNVPLKPYYVSSAFLDQCSKYDYEGSLIGDKANSVVFCNTKLKQLVPEFVATKRFDQGIRETLEYVLSHKECQKDDPDFDNWCDVVIAALEKAKKEILGDVH